MTNTDSPFRIMQILPLLCRVFQIKFSKEQLFLSISQAGNTSTRIDKGGRGLGLYISNFIITEHKGYISFAPNSPQGTVVTVHLPLLYA